MNYQNIYDSLIDRAKKRKLEGYLERHHIIPRCIGGSDLHSNLVDLTAREHFFAHQLLVRIHPGVRGLSWAALLMAGKNKFNPGLSRQYAFLKKIASEDIARDRKGKGFPKSQGLLDRYARARGVPLSDETKAKLSSSQKGRTFSEETIERMRNAARNRPPMSDGLKEFHRERMRGNDFRKGIPNTPEMKQRLLNAHLGRVQSAEEKAKRGAARRRITDEQIRLVRLCFSLNPESTNQEVSDETGVSKTQVSRIRLGQKYSEVI